MLNSTLSLLGLGEVMRQQLGLALDPIWKVLFEGCGNPGMELVSRATQQSTVGGILHQGMLELIFRRRRGAALKHQPSGDETCERGLCFCFAARPYGRQ